MPLSRTPVPPSSPTQSFNPVHVPIQANIERSININPGEVKQNLHHDVSDPGTGETKTGTGCSYRTASIAFLVSKLSANSDIRMATYRFLGPEHPLERQSWLPWMSTLLQMAPPE
jgi:hypothetical protein